MKKHLIMLAIVTGTLPHLAMAQNDGDLEIEVDAQIEYREPAKPNAVDMGGDVLWASFNLFAENPTDVGVYVGWGDPNGTLEYQADDPNEEHYLPRATCLAMYGGTKPKYQIFGTEYDIATRFLGAEWRLPDEDDFEQLVEDCKWEIEKRGNTLGYRIIAKNGNSIFLPSWNDERIDINEGKKVIYGGYWAGRLWEFPIDDFADGAYAYSLNLAAVPFADSGYQALSPAPRWTQLMIRPVKDKTKK